MKKKEMISVPIWTEKCDDCRYKGIDGGPSPSAVCAHPKAGGYCGYIISRKGGWGSPMGSDYCPLVTTAKPVVREITREEMSKNKGMREREREFAERILGPIFLEDKKKDNTHE